MTQPFDNAVEDISGSDFLDNIGDEDFILILDQSGDLKTILLPEDRTEDIPEKLTKILSLLGVSNFQARTLH
jgi:hypothetical protein